MNRRRSNHNKNYLFPTKVALALVLPSIILYMFFNIWPIVFSIGIAFTNATRENILPNPERIKGLKNAIACANYLKTSEEYKESARILLADVMDYMESIKSTLISMLKVIEANNSEMYIELGQQVAKLSSFVRRLTRVRPDIARVFNCSALGYETSVEILPRDIIDKIDRLINLAGLLANYQALDANVFKFYTEVGLNITNSLEAYFLKLEEDYEDYLEKFIFSTNKDLDRLQLKIVGLDNFARLFSDPRFYNSLYKTLLFTVVSVPMKVLLGVLLALFYSSPMIYGKRVMRAFLLVPWATPFLLSATTWKFMSLPNGPLGMAFNLNVNTDEWDAFIVYCLFETWLAYPFIMTITQGALSGLSKEVIEAAYIDGAGLWSRIRKIVFPLISKPVTIATILTTGTSLQVFMIPLVINGGYPIGEIRVPYIGSAVGYKNEVLMLFGYNRIMIDNEYGYAASMYLVVVLIIVAYVTLWFTISRRFSR
ncbi:MAG: sugar ABC transporter permease [Ignisphaera sp.]